jgi:hypothetical protein
MGSDMGAAAPVLELPVLLTVLQAGFSEGDARRMQGIVEERLGPARARSRQSLVTYVRALHAEVDWESMPQPTALTRVLDDIPEDAPLSFEGRGREEVLATVMERVPSFVLSYELVSCFRSSTIALAALAAALDAQYGATPSVAALRKRVRLRPGEFEKCAWRMAASISMDFTLLLSLNGGAGGAQAGRL